MKRVSGKWIASYTALLFGSTKLLSPIRARLKAIDDRVLYWANRSTLNIVLFLVGLALLCGISFTAVSVAFRLLVELTRL